MPGPRRSRLALGAAATVVLVAAAVFVVHRTSPPEQRLPHFVDTSDYRPGEAGDLYLPTPTPQRAPVVVLIPGGAWLSADRDGLGPLAESLAAHGVVVVNATYRAVNAGVRFPVPVADIVCAIDFAADRARRQAVSVGPIVVLGHSSGAHLAALAALRTAHFRRDCPYPPARVDGLIGLAGPYAVTQLADIAYPLFGSNEATSPALWHDGNPMDWVTERTAAPALPVLLAHGAADQELSTSFTEGFAQALKHAGHPVQVNIIADATHSSIYTPKVITHTIMAWLTAVNGAPR
jgi:acetyl esterase/lipase